MTTSSRTDNRLPDGSYPESHARLTGQLVRCYGCDREMPDTKGMWSRSGKYFLCGPGCPGDREGKDESVFSYFRQWVRRETPSW